MYLLDDAIISPIGFSTSENLESIRKNKSGIKFYSNKRFSSGGFYAGILEEKILHQHFSELGLPENFTKLERMMLLAVHKVLEKNRDLDLNETALLVSSTKGNIDLLKNNSKFPENRVLLSELAKVIKNFFGFKKNPIVVSNACISGGLSLAIAKRLIEAGKFKQAIVVGGDLVSDFVVSGFQSFQALSQNPCQPFSKNRDGINLGEAAAAILVGSGKSSKKQNIRLTGASSANDANHISGPSRTGEGLYKSIQLALKEAGISSEKIQHLSSHGTATIFNDEMEANAFTRAGLQNVPVNSYKGYYGHTLGASALIESILTKHSLQNQELFRSANFEETGVSKHLNIIEIHQNLKMKYALKTASGFGGCNLALVLEKEDDE